MARTTHKNIFSLVKKEIDKSLQFNNNEAREFHQSTDSFALSGNALSNVTTADLVTAIHNLLKDALPGSILSGLAVRATDPETGSVVIEAGKGTKGGEVYELLTDVTLAIPFNNETTVFYITLFKDRVMIDKDEDDQKLVLAKIIVPEPGVTDIVVDQKDNTSNAYILSFQPVKFYQDKWGRFEEDSLEFLRDNFGAIAAENIIGNLRLSENLKIINTQGTLEINSQAVKILNTSGDRLAEFNKDGTFFYDSNGIEVARFANDNAKIGNMLLTKNSIQSADFVTNQKGFKIGDDGKAEFEDAIIRGVLRASVFEKDTISSIGGQFIVAESDVLNADMSALDSSNLTIKGDVNFAVGDILRIKSTLGAGVEDEWLEVTDISSAPTYVVTRDKKASYTSDNNPAWSSGTAVINYGQSGSGIIYMTGSETDSPYISIITHTGTPWSASTERLRIGKLDGFLDYPSTGESGWDTSKFGIAVGETTKFLKYDPDNGLRIRGNLTMDSGFIGGEGGWQITTNEIIGSTNSVIRGGMTDYATGSGFWIGYHDGSGDEDAYKFSIGDTSNWLRWNGTTLSIKGSLTMDAGSSIGSGVITSDAFIDTVEGDISVGAVFAKRTMDANQKWTEYQTAELLDESGSTHTIPSGGTGFVVGNGILQVPSANSYDNSGEDWDESGTQWDANTEPGTWIWESVVKDVGEAFFMLPILQASRTITTPNSMSVEIKYSEDNVTWSDYSSAFPSTVDGTTTFYFNNIVKARYLQYRITFNVTDTTTSVILENLWLKALAVYQTLIYPDQTFNAPTDEVYTISGLSEWFSKEYTVSIMVHGTSLVRGQIVSKDDPPGSIEIKLVDESNTKVAGTADITLIGY